MKQVRAARRDTLDSVDTDTRSRNAWHQTARRRHPARQSLAAPYKMPERPDPENIDHDGQHQYRSHSSSVATLHAVVPSVPGPIATSAPTPLVSTHQS